MVDGQPFADLGPEVVLDAVESVGLMPDGRLLPLNSYENRVYQVGIEDAAPVVVKVYRPGRWSDAAIEEEHEFARRLAEHEVPVVPAMAFDGRSLFHHAGYRFAVTPRMGGHWPELATEDDRLLLGRFLGRLHAVGDTGRFQHRERMGLALVEHAREGILESGWLPEHLEAAYESITEHLLARVEAAWEAVTPRLTRIHGDFHRGNILWDRDRAHVVDLDDTCTGPAVQDVWMLLAGGREESETLLGDIIAGYREFHDFDPSELALIEPLRAMRQIRYAAWLTDRWDDPAFPQAFPWFGTDRYWEDHVLALKEQLADMDEPVLQVEG